MTTLIQFVVVFKLLLGLAHGAPINFNYDEHEFQDPKTLSFKFEVEDPETNNVQFRNENRYPNGTVEGSYGYLELNGNIHMVHYVADENGYRATIEDSLRRGALKPIPVLDTDYLAYGFSPEMLIALKSHQVYNHQDEEDQRLRPFDKQNEEEKLQYLNEEVNKVGEKDVTLKSTNYVDTKERNNIEHYLGDFKIFEDEEKEEDNSYDFQFFI